MQGKFWINYFVLTDKANFQLLEFNAPGHKDNFGTILGQFQGQFQGQFWVNYFLLTDKTLFQLMEFDAPEHKDNFGTILRQFQGQFWDNSLVLTI